jgi:pyridinium-3,5-biscarboxylic acid mononucleotide sulfurtransferase
MTIPKNKLQKIISKYKSAVIAFSGGVDSTFIARFAKEILNNKIILVTISFSAVPEQEIEDSIKIASELNLKHKIIKIDELKIPHFSENTPDRCYHCKKYIFTQVKNYAESINYEVVFDGTNADDADDFRPGRKALLELNIISPLHDAGITKNKIRELSKLYNLRTASKPSYACLASRIPYGETINAKKLKKIASVEKEIRILGFSQFRVRNHNNLARLEFIAEEMEKAWNMRKIISKICTRAGYTYTAIDCTGYKTGNLNLDLTKDVIGKYRT